GRRRIEAGTAFVLFPGVWHRYGPHAANGWDEYWFGFDGEQAQRVMGPPFFTIEQSVIEVGDEPHLLDNMTQLASLISDDAPGVQRVLSGLALAALGSIQQRSHYGGDPQAAIEQALTATKQRLAAAIDRPIDGKVLATELGVNYHWLRRVFRRHTGFSLHQYHLQLRLSRAMELLEGTDAEIREIASMLGYDDPYYFSRVFSKGMGLPPAQWRRRRRGMVAGTACAL
ncbi:MAG: helix-turn-helix domain-containing protein, partial [Planctomycetota bacterium]